MDIQQIDTERILGPTAPGFDYDEWSKFLKEVDASEEWKQEYARLSWNLIFQATLFVKGMHPVQQTDHECGLNSSNSKMLFRDQTNLMNDKM